MTARVSSSKRIGSRAIDRGVAPPRADRIEQALAEQDLGRRRRCQLARIRREEAQLRRLGVDVRQVEHAALDTDERGELGEDHPTDHLDVALALEHSPEAGDVRLEPVDLLVALRRLAQVANHLVDVVLEELDLALRVNLDGPR